MNFRPKDEQLRMENKIKKICRFWNKNSLLIPNVFRLTSQIAGESRQILEYLDLSKKELLGISTFSWLIKVQSNGQKALDKQSKKALKKKALKKKQDLKKDSNLKVGVLKKESRDSATTGPSENFASPGKGRKGILFKIRSRGIRGDQLQAQPDQGSFKKS